MPFHFIENVTRADIAFEATGKTLSELFASSAQAVIEAMANPKTILPKITKKIVKKEETVESLLFEFLEEIIYLKDVEGMVFSDVLVLVNEKTLEATATLHGDHINTKTQELHQDVKAITMHYYKVEHKNQEWRTQIVLDI